MFRKRVKGDMLVNVLVGIALTVGVVALGYSASSKQIAKANIEEAQTQLTLLASAVSEAYTDLGQPIFDNTQMAEFGRYANELANGYLGGTFDETTLAVKPDGFTVDLKSPVDPYKQPYHFRFVTTADASNSVMISCWGADGVDDSATYVAGNYGDDIVAVTYARTS